LLIIPNDKTFFHQICEDLKKDPFIVDIQNQLRNQHQIQDLFSNCAKFKFRDGLLYCDGLLYVLDGLIQFQVFQARHDVLGIIHFGFNKTMELVFRHHWWPQL
jgi:hypothetical protein